MGSINYIGITKKFSTNPNLSVVISGNVPSGDTICSKRGIVTVTGVRNCGTRAGRSPGGVSGMRADPFV